MTQLGSHLEWGRVGSVGPGNSMAQAQGLPFSAPNQDFQHLCGITQSPVSPTQQGGKRSKQEMPQLWGQEGHLVFEPRRASFQSIQALLQDPEGVPDWLSSGLESRGGGERQTHLKPTAMNQRTTQTVGGFTQDDGTWVGMGSWKDG